MPGYGRSAPLRGPHDKRSTGDALLATLSTLISISSPSSPQPIFITGHDRGARVCHQLAVDAASLPKRFSLTIKGTILLDIVPTLTQWTTFSDPTVSTGSFHWPFLANPSISVPMILAQGGDIWTRMCLERWVGKDPTSRESFASENAIEVYASFMAQGSVIKASCDDYRAGAQEDIHLQKEDQKAGRKVAGRVLVLYSAKYLGGRYDVRKVWEEWVQEDWKQKLEVQGLGGECGHFLAEERPEETAAAIAEFWARH
jgi:pimeloyl-ACP methyl ester carboxylesterase